MNHPSTSGPLGMRIIGALKLANAVFLGAAAFGIFHLMRGNLGETLTHLALRLRLDPENRLVHGAIRRLSGIDPAQLKALGAGTIFYGVLEAVEGVGLLLQRHWASYLTILATALLLIPEGYEIAQKPTAIRLLVLAANLAILVYLVVKVRQERRGRNRAEASPPGSAPGFSGSQDSGR